MATRRTLSLSALNRLTSGASESDRETRENPTEPKEPSAVSGWRPARFGARPEEGPEASQGQEVYPSRSLPPMNATVRFEVRSALL